MNYLDLAKGMAMMALLYVATGAYVHQWQSVTNFIVYNGYRYGM